MIFRVDDVSINTDLDRLEAMVNLLHDRFGDIYLMLAVSPMVVDAGERCYPKHWNALSDHRIFYEVEGCGLPDLNRFTCDVAAHGLIHVDHRLLPYAAQELSIVTSVSLTGAYAFVPPFNKWNADTEAICQEHEIELIKFENGWASLEHEPFDPEQQKWYFHTHQTTLESLRAWCE